MNTTHYLESLTDARTVPTTRLSNHARGHHTSDLARWGHRRSTTTLTIFNYFPKLFFDKRRRIHSQCAYNTPLNSQTRTASKMTRGLPTTAIGRTGCTWTDFTSYTRRSRPVAG